MLLGYLSWRGPLLPIAALAGIPALLIWLAVTNGPFVVAMVLFSPVASLLMVVAMSLMLAAGAGLKRHIADSVAWMRSRRQCAACRYDLTGVEPCREGVTTCPECGARWRLGRADGPPVIVIKASDWSIGGPHHSVSISLRPGGAMGGGRPE